MGVPGPSLEPNYSTAIPLQPTAARITAMQLTPYIILMLAPACLAVEPLTTNSESQWLFSDKSRVRGPVTDLNIVNKVISPDGFSRSAVLAEGMFPGPLITAEKGDDFRINVINQLNDPSMDNSTSVHWHGIFQRKSNWADGVTGVTQCPINPGRSFLHQFNAHDQAGTFWYHSHYSLQYCDGLRGPLVIYDPNDPLGYLYDVDNANTVITLADWYHVPAAQVSIPANESSTLINGLGRYNGGPSTPLAVFTVQQGKRYRFRILALSCDPSFNFTIDGHEMRVIETDSVEIEPLLVDSIAVYASQRYSIVVTADQPVGNYWIRALASEPGHTFDNGQNSAILRYEGAPVAEPTTEHGPYLLPYADLNAHPLINPGAPGIPEPGKADVNINLVPGLNSELLFTLNNISFAIPSLPVLLQILSGARHPLDLLPSGSVYVLPPDKVIEISIPATQLTPGGAIGGPHPIHLHGHTFDVIRAPGSSTYNFKNPVRRDVISTGDERYQDNVTFRFRTNNPGPWFLHCHIDFHLNAGFAVVLAEAPNKAAHEESDVVPGAWVRLCE